MPIILDKHWKLILKATGPSVVRLIQSIEKGVSNRPKDSACNEVRCLLFAIRGLAEDLSTILAPAIPALATPTIATPAPATLAIATLVPAILAIATPAPTIIAPAIIALAMVGSAILVISAILAILAT